MQVVEHLQHYGRALLCCEWLVQQSPDASSLGAMPAGWPCPLLHTIPQAWWRCHLYLCHP